jgi:hypothetical protein
MQLNNEGEICWELALVRRKQNAAAARTVFFIPGNKFMLSNYTLATSGFDRMRKWQGILEISAFS